MTSAASPDVPARRRAFAYRAGLDALAAIWPASSEPIPYPRRDEAEALRSDCLRIGDDLRGIIEREAARGQIKPD